MEAAVVAEVLPAVAEPRTLSAERRRFFLMSDRWLCPYCGTFSMPAYYTTSDGRKTQDGVNGNLQTNLTGRDELSLDFRVEVRLTQCPNPVCERYELRFAYGRRHRVRAADSDGINPRLGEWRLVPGSAARVHPDYVPAPIREDYEEACAILELSPKASATLSRRALQGMIRDFWGIRKATLNAEIKALEEHVASETWAAIDAVRKVGNIGAHMEKDINVIVDVDPGEADDLIALIETLIDDWYIARNDREERLARVQVIAAEKEEARGEQQRAADTPEAAEEV